MRQPPFDSFYLQRFAVKLRPLNLAAAALSTEILVLVGFLRNTGNDDARTAQYAGVGLILLLLAWLCHVFATRDNLAGTVTVALLFAGIASTLGTISASEHGRGAVSTMPTAMMMCFVAGIIAQRYWHVVLSWLMVVGSIVYVATLEPPVIPQQDYQLGRFMFGVVSTTSVFYWIGIRVKRGYYDLYLRMDLQSRIDDLTGVLNRRAWREEAGNGD
jgi:hypothetical protein